MTLDILPSASDVLVLRIHEKLERDDVLRVIRLMEDSISRNDKTHIFVEDVGFTGFDLQHLPEYLRLGWPLMGKLKRFGRIAVVSDQAWLRVTARIESALLPNISYETFDLSESEQALAWVEGRASHARGAGLRVVETNRPDVLAFEIDGKLTEDDLEQIAERFMAEGAGRAPTRVIGKILRLDGAELEGLVDDDFVKMKLAAFSTVERYAVIGGPAWLGRWVRLADGLAKAEIRHFPSEDETAAWDWIGAESRQNRPAVQI